MWTITKKNTMHPLFKSGIIEHCSQMEGRTNAMNTQGSKLKNCIGYSDGGIADIASCCSVTVDDDPSSVRFFFAHRPKREYAGGGGGSKTISMKSHASAK